MHTLAMSARVPAKLWATSEGLTVDTLSRRTSTLTAE